MAHFVIALTGDTGNATLRGSPLRLAPYADQIEAQNAIAWQGQGGFDRAGYAIATVDRDLPGVMRATDGRPVLIDNHGWTTEAFARFVVKTWGHLA